MKIKLPQDKKKKLNPIITIVVSLLLIGSCVSCNTNSEEEKNPQTSSSEITTEITTTATDKTTTETTTTETTTETTTTEKTTETTTTETTTKTTATEKTAEIVECPDLSGINYDEAIKMYSAYITIKKDSEEHNSYISAGSIIEQDIKFPSKVEKGTVVKVKVSLGPISVQTTPPQAVQPAEPVASNIHFILNTDTNCIHTKADCSAAQKILPENYSEIDISNSELANYANVYWACGKCSKEYSSILPKF